MKETDAIDAANVSGKVHTKSGGNHHECAKESRRVLTEKKTERPKANHQAGTELPAHEGNGMREAGVKETISHNASKG